MDLLSERSVYDRAWWRESIIYQIYVPSFKDCSGNGIGDLNGVIAKLDYLYQLGVDIIQLSPIYDTPLGGDKTYEVRDYEKISGMFGTMEDWKRLLDEVHKRRMRLILDIVLNHTSYQVNL